MLYVYVVFIVLSIYCIITCFWFLCFYHLCLSFGLISHVLSATPSAPGQNQPRATSPQAATARATSPNETAALPESGGSALDPGRARAMASLYSDRLRSRKCTPVSERISPKT